jgi:DNA-binding transcriptional ArsR family regulator
MTTSASGEHPLPPFAIQTHNGKIARLPQVIREQLNRRLNDGEPGGGLLEWLNALPAVQAVLAAEFGGSRISPQNLSNWRRGGYQHWQKQQERRANVRQLTEDTRELTDDAGGVEVSHHLSAVLVAELTESARDSLATVTDPVERCARIGEFLHALARVRRQDNLAGRLAIERERRARERVEEKEKDERRKECARDWEPMKLHFKRSYMADLYAQPDFTSQAMATRDAESLLRDVKLGPSGPVHSVAPVAPNQTESNQIKPNQTNFSNGHAPVASRHDDAT